MPAIDINRGTTGIALPAEISREIWGKTVEQSAVMRLARRIDLPGAGLEIQLVTGEPTAAWTAETDAKPVSTHTFSTKTMKGYTLAVIEPFSNQFRRDKKALYDELVRRLPYAIGKKFDETVFFGTAPGTGFDTLASATAVNLTTDPWAGLVAADAAVSAADGILNGWAISPQAKSILLAKKDNQGRPLFVDSVAQGSIPALLGQDAYITKHVYKAASGSGTAPVLGFAGDWTSAVYGVIEGIKIDISDQATLTIGESQVNLWERNMFAVRAEIEVGFVAKDADQFVQLVGETVAETPAGGGE